MSATEIRKELATVRREMKAKGIRRTSCFNGGHSSESYRLNAEIFRLQHTPTGRTMKAKPKFERGACRCYCTGKDATLKYHRCRACRYADNPSVRFSRRFKAAKKLIRARLHSLMQELAALL